MFGRRSEVMNDAEELFNKVTEDTEADSIEFGHLSTSEQFLWRQCLQLQLEIVSMNKTIVRHAETIVRLDNDLIAARQELRALRDGPSPVRIGARLDDTLARLPKLPTEPAKDD